MNALEILSQREVGTVPLSIGTSVPIETLMKNKDLEKEGYRLFINLRTLIRNLFSSLPTAYQDMITPGAAAATILEEIQQIKRLVPAFVPTVYHLEYRDLKHVLPRSQLRPPETTLQKIHQAQQNDIIRLLTSKQTTLIQTFPTTQLQVALGSRGLLITHMPVDLLSYPKFSSLELLESYTGAIKGRSEWHTKLTGGKNNARIPFTGVSLTIFGDNGQLLKPYSIKERNIVKRIAEKLKWTSVTSSLEFRIGLRNNVDPEFRDRIDHMSKL